MKLNTFIVLFYSSSQTVCRPKYVNDSPVLISPRVDYEAYLRELAASSYQKTRHKRQNTNKSNTLGTRPTKKKQVPNRCNVAMVADYKFFKEIGNSNAKLTTAYLMNIIASVNTIFTRTKWSYDDDQDGDVSTENYGFYIEKIIVHSEPNPGAKEHYNSEISSLDADKVLELFGEEDWTAYCLAHLFTYASFQNGVLGLAYVSSPKSNTLGGICSTYTRSQKASMFSVNTGLSSYRSTSLTQGRLLQREAELVTAHG